MKKLSVIALSTMLMTAPAFAETTLNYSTNQITQQEVDLSAVFTNNQNLQVATLSTQEMQETEGAFIPLPLAALTLGGGAIGAWGNHAHSYHKTGQVASVNDTVKATGVGMAVGASTYGAGAALRPVVGTPQNWIRVGDSYSKLQDVPTKAIRWGSNKHHQKKIGNQTLRDLNNKLHESKLPGNNWRVNDKGHFHLWKK